MSTQEIDWQALSAPFDPADVDFRPQGKSSTNGNVQVVAYVDARTVMARLDEACGPDGWSFTWEPIVVELGQVQIAKGRLTIGGVVCEDVGEASNFDPSKGCVSDTLKRVAVQFGVARYLYDIERTWVKASGERLDERVIAGLRERLPRPAGMQPTQSTFAAHPPTIHKPADEPAAAVTPPPAKRGPKLETLADVQQALANYRNVLGITDKAIIATDGKLDYDASLKRRSEYVEAWKRRSVEQQKEQQKAGATR